MSKLVQTKGAILVVPDDAVEGQEPIEIQIATDDAEAREEPAAPRIVFAKDLPRSAFEVRWGVGE